MDLNEMLNKAANDVERESLRAFFARETDPKEIQYFDVKLLTDSLPAFRARVQADIAAFREWKASALLQRDYMARIIMAEQGADLLIKLWSSRSAYSALKDMTQKARADYMSALMRG